jgi:signal transduction histidine kinase
VTYISEVADGKIWCGIEDRIWEFDGNTWNLIRAGFERVNGITKAADGSVWVASDNGLHRYFHGTWTANGMEEGLPSGAIRSIYQDHRGRYWAATFQGLCEYHPEADPDPPRTHVQNLAERNNTVREGAIVNISFSAQDKWKYTAEDRLLYSYRLDGQDWSPYQEQRTVSFLDLPAGKHTFSVRSMDRNWNVDPKPARLEFAVALPWFRETRLLLISAAGLGGALFFAAVAFNRHRQLMRSYAEVEAQVALRTKQLELANHELFHSQKMNALGTLAAGIAHDFNNILSIIKGSAQIIETNLEDQDKIRVRTDRIKTVVEQGAGIVKAMLGFSRTSDHQLTPCDINAVMSDTIKLLGDRFLREIEVQFTPAPSLPEVPASKDFIQQILLNFIFNAAEAMTEKRRQVILGITQSKQLPATMALKPDAAPSYVMISVKDFGTGISPEIMPRIFEPFFTTKAFSTRRGTGLGLSMVYELTRQMDGGLSVESTLGQGSVFTLILPVRELPMDAPAKSDKVN